MEVIDEEIEDLATEENQMTVGEEPNNPRADLRASSVTGKYGPEKNNLLGAQSQANINGKGKSRADPENGMEGFGGIVGIGQQKKHGSMSVQNPNKKNEDPKGAGNGLGIGIGGGV